MQVNGVPISDEDLEALVDQIRPIANTLTDSPTEFELITALGFLYFLQAHCDIVVLEVGLGGALDSTNVIPAPEAAVITALGLDHTAVLGDTIQDVARAKAGIIKPGSPVISYGGVPEADAVIAAVCKEQDCPLYPVDFSQLTPLPSDLSGTRFSFGNLENLALPLLGSYQPYNAAVAITTLKVLDQRGWHISDAAIREGCARSSGRDGLSCCAPNRPSCWTAATTLTECVPPPRACRIGSPVRNSPSSSPSWRTRT